MRWFLGRTLAVLALGLTLVGSLPERARADDAAALSEALRATRAEDWAAADAALRRLGPEAELSSLITAGLQELAR